MKHFKKIDRFGEKFSFKYNGYDKYSTRIGGLVCLIIGLISLGNFIVYFVPFIQKKNFNLQFYTVNSKDTETIILNKSFIFGIDCGEKNKTFEAYDQYFEIKVKFQKKIKNETKTNETEKNETNNNITIKNCTGSYFDKEVYEIIKNLSINDLKLEDYKCFSEYNNKVQGIFTSDIFAYYKITISKKENKSFSEINNFLFENDCKLQFYYVDYVIEIENYKEPIKPIFNSLFIQLNPDFYIKKNVYFMNYHFISDDRLFHIFQLENKGENEKIKTGLSRTEDYFLYKGVDTSSDFSDKNDYATIYVRIDNKKMEIKREYQNILDFYAENSAFWISLFEVLNFIFTIYNDFHANRSISKKLFFFEEKENNKYNYLKRRNSTSSNNSFSNNTNVNRVNEITINDIEDKDNNKNTMPIIYTPKMYNNYIASSDKGFSKKKTIRKKQLDKEKEKEKKKNPFSILSLLKIYICGCFKIKLNFKEKLIIKAVDIFEKKLDIYIYIKNMILIDIMFKVLMDDINKDCIDFLSRSLIYLDKKKKEEEEELENFYKPVSKFNTDNLDKLYSEFKNLMEKNGKTEIENKIISLYTDY